MPGICAIVRRGDTQGCSTMIGRMLDCMRHHDWYVDSRYSDDRTGAALGRISLGYLNTAPQPVASQDGSFVLVMDGELYDAGAVGRTLGLPAEAIDGQNHAQLLLQGIARQGKAFVKNLHGSFVAAIWDVRGRRLSVCNDRFASRPLYYARSTKRFLAASSIAPLMVDKDLSRNLNPRGLSQFFTFGHYFGDDTLWEAIRVLPAATWLTYDAQKDRIELDTHWTTFDDDRPRTEDPRALLEEINQSFDRAVERRTRATQGLGLALSGGLDARTILGVMNQDTAHVKTVCLGMSGSSDHRCSQQMAEIVGCEHHNHVLDERFLAGFSDHMRQMVRLTDGQYLSQCIVMPTLPVYRELGIRVLLRGHAGELLHMQKAYNYSLDREALAINSDAHLEQWLLRRLRAYLMDGVDVPLFSAASQRDLDGLAQDSLRDCLRPLREVSPRLQRVWHLFVNQRLRRETMLSMVKFNSVVEPRLPYLDNDLVSLLLATPPSLKLSEEIQTFILRERCPAFLRVVNTNTGAKLGAGRLSRTCATFRLKVLAKLGAPGYQPYERIGLWLRRELTPFVREVLLSDACLERGIFKPEGIKSVVSNHLEDRRNHTYLLLALMIFELGQRTLTTECAPKTCDDRLQGSRGAITPATKEI